MRSGFRGSGRVDAGRWFVQNEEPWILDESLSEADALKHSFGKTAQPPVGCVFESDDF